MLKNITKAISLLFTVALVAVLCIGVFAGANEEIVFAALRANSQYSLAGAKYQLYTNESCTTAAKDISGNNAVFTTDASGNTGTIEIEQGTYYAKEIKASPGYRLDPDVSGPIVIGDKNTASNPASFVSKEPPVYGVPDFTLFKVDRSGKYGWKALTGAEYTVRYYDVASKEEIDESHLMKSWTFRTRKTEFDKNNCIFYAGFDWQTDDPVSGSDDFYVVNGKRVLPLGWFTIQEVDAPSGLSISSEVFYGHVSQPSSGADAKTQINGADSGGNLITRIYANEEPQSVTIRINKKTAQNNPEGQLVSTASLEGAVYEVYFDDSDKPVPELVGTITTDENGQGILTKREAGDERKIGDPLDAGDYIIREVKASPGYLIDRYVIAGNGGSIEEFEGETEVTASYESDGGPVTRTLNGMYKDGQQIFKARIQGRNIPAFEYTVTSKEYATETHIKKTDATTTKEIPGAKLQIIKDDKVIEEWVSTRAEHIVYGLESGIYTLREITAPYGYDIAEDISFTVSDSKVVTKVEMKNKPVKIETEAADAITDTHHGVKNGFEQVTDEVTVTGLHKGRKYQIYGKLWNKKTNDFVKDAEGNDLTVLSDEFTAEDDKVKKEISFYIDSSGFTDDTSLVAFEYLARVEELEDRDESGDFPKELAKHEDAGDEAQTIYYGGIAETEAVDEKSGDHIVPGSRRAVITDTVRYQNLSTFDEYIIEGELYDKTEGKLTGITGYTVFRPESSDGYTEVEFSFDAEDYTGHSLVAYEVLSANGTVVCRHEDPDDEDQTVDITEPEEDVIISRVDTGDKTMIGLLAAAFLMSGSFLGILFAYRAKHKDNDRGLLV